MINNDENKVDYEIEYYKFIYEHKITNKDPDKEYHLHHIQPLSLSGRDTKDNIVCLLPKDHLKAHELFFKMHLQAVIKAAHAIVSMVPDKKYLNAQILSIDALDEYQTNMIEAIKKIRSTSKKTIVNIQTLEMKKINSFDEIEEGWIEKPCKSKHQKFVYIEGNIEAGKILWNPEYPLPDKSWKFLNDAPEEIKIILNPCSFYKQEEEYIPMRYVHSLSTNKNKLIPKDAPLPEGYAERMYVSPEAKERMRIGGLKSAQREKAKYSTSNKWRWIFDMKKLKNDLIPKDAPLPDNCIEGRHKIDIDENSI